MTQIRYFAIHDNCDNKKRRGAIEIKKSEIKKYNSDQFGIFQAVNEFNGARKIANCTKINYWLCDIDDGTKDEMCLAVENLALRPTVVIETKKGIHCYWRSVDGGVENYSKICEGIIEKLNGDRACKDPSRLLRVPYTNHWKDPNDPYEIGYLMCNKNTYTEAQMMCAFPVKRKTTKKQYNIDFSSNDLLNPDRWEKIFKPSKITQGCRNECLYAISQRLHDKGLSCHEVTYVIEGLNNMIYEPLGELEIKQICRG